MPASCAIWLPTLKVVTESTLLLTIAAGMGMERALFIRERNDGLYRPLIYLLYKLLDELLLMLPVTTATTATVFLACRLQGSFLLFWLVNFVTLANGTGRQQRSLLRATPAEHLGSLAWRQHASRITCM